MKISSVTEAISRIPQAGIVDSTDRWDQGYLEFLAITYRNKLGQLVYQRDKRLNPSWYQKVWPVFEPLLQDNACCVKFRHPQVMVLDSYSDGFRYCGTLNFANGFARVQSRSWLSTFNANPVTSVNKMYEGKGAYLYDGNQQVVEVYGMPQITQILTEVLAQDPNEVTTWNKTYDNFPFPDNLISDLVQLIYQEVVVKADSKPVRPQDIPSGYRPKRTKQS